MGSNARVATVREGDWVNLNRVLRKLSFSVFGADSTPTFNGLNITGTIDMNDNAIIDLGYMDFNPDNGVSPMERRLVWNDDDGTLNLGMKGGNVNQQIGLEVMVRGKNTTGSTISNGAAVRISGASGTNPEFGLSKADEPALAGSIGLATEEFATSGDSQFGYLTTFGLVRDIDTSGPGAETWSAGDRIYVSNTAGVLTDTPPTGSERIIFVGSVIVANQTEGQVLVNPINVPYLNELSGVELSPSDNDLLQYDSASKIWKNTSLVGTANRVTVTNGAGTITLSGPQDIHTGASPTFSELTLTSPGTTGYKFLGNSISGTLSWQKTSAGQARWGFYPSIGDGTENSALDFYAVGTPTNRVNEERLIIGFSAAGQSYVISSDVRDSGVRHPIIFDASGGTSQLIIESETGNVSFGGNIIISDEGYIGSVNLPQAIQIGFSIGVVVEDLFTANDGVIFGALVGPSGIYIDSDERVTTVIPTSGALGYLTRTGTALTTTNANDSFRVGDATNNTTFDGSGTQIMAGTARAKKIIILSAAQSAIAGGNIPAQVILGNYAGREYELGDISYFEFEVPYDCDVSENIEIEIHWYIDRANPDKDGPADEFVQWRVSYTATKEDDTEAVDAVSANLDSGDISISDTAKHLVQANIGEITIEQNDVVGMILTRIASSNEPGGAPAEHPVALSIEIEYTTNKLGQAL